MTIQYLPPLRRAWQRMVDQLFRPFDFKKWFVLGFTCFLVRLLEGGGGGGGGGVPGPNGSIDVDPSDIDFSQYDPRTWWEPWAQELGFGLLLAGIGCILLMIIAVVVLVMWIGSRGHFLFLDNVVQDRALVVQPWKEYHREGNSLFLWRLVFSLLCIVAILLLAVPGVWILWTAQDGESTASIVTGLVVLLLPVLVAAVIVALIDLFLTDFVVPIMYRKRLKTMEAWRAFLPRLRQNLASLVLYALLVLGLHILLFLILAGLCLATCCVALLVLWIPLLSAFLSAQFLLPLHVTYRLFSVEFLAQLGPDFDLLPPAPTDGGTPPAEPAPTVGAA